MHQRTGEPYPTNRLEEGWSAELIAGDTTLEPYLRVDGPTSVPLAATTPAGGLLTAIDGRTVSADLPDPDALAEWEWQETARILASLEVTRDAS